MYCISAYKYCIFSKALKGIGVRKAGGMDKIKNIKMNYKVSIFSKLTDHWGKHTSFSAIFNKPATCNNKGSTLQKNFVFRFFLSF